MHVTSNSRRITTKETVWRSQSFVMEKELYFRKRQFFDSWIRPGFGNVLHTQIIPAAGQVVRTSEGRDSGVSHRRRGWNDAHDGCMQLLSVQFVPQ